MEVAVTHDANLVNSLLVSWDKFGKAQGWKVAFLLTSGGVTIFGVATWGRPVARLLDQETQLQLTRFALHPKAPIGAEDFFLAEMENWILQNMPMVQTMIGYQDYRLESGGIFGTAGWQRGAVTGAGDSTWTNRPRRRASERPSRIKWTKQIGG